MNNSPKAPFVNQLYDTWIAGYTAGDTQKVMSVFDRELRYDKPCQPVQNFESLAAWYEFDFKRQDMPRRPTWAYEIESIDLGSDLAVVVSQWTGVTNFGGFSANVERLRSIDVFRRDADGVWKIVRTVNDALTCDAPVKTTLVQVQGRKPGKVKILRRRPR